jgi:hypothetical protein
MYVQMKCESVVVNVLAVEQILDELETLKYISVMVDISIHKRLKLLPVLFRYFIPDNGNQIKVIEFHKLKGELANVLTMYIMTVLHNYKLSYKIIALCGDITNFGGATLTHRHIFVIENLIQVSIIQ